MSLYNKRTNAKFPRKSETQHFTKAVSDNLYPSLYRISFGEYRYTYRDKVIIQIEADGMGYYRATLYEITFDDPSCDDELNNSETDTSQSDQSDTKVEARLKARADLNSTENLDVERDKDEDLIQEEDADADTDYVSKYDTKSILQEIVEGEDRIEVRLKLETLWVQNNHESNVWIELLRRHVLCVEDVLTERYGPRIRGDIFNHIEQEGAVKPAGCLSYDNLEGEYHATTIPISTKFYRY